eukprot:scaffold249903_cov36-Tisochrysis_lutea.AAC.1
MVSVGSGAAGASSPPVAQAESSATAARHRQKSGSGSAAARSAPQAGSCGGGAVSSVLRPCAAKRMASSWVREAAASARCAAVVPTLLRFSACTSSRWAPSRILSSCSTTSRCSISPCGSLAGGAPFRAAMAAASEADTSPSGRRNVSASRRASAIPCAARARAYCRQRTCRKSKA